MPFKLDRLKGRRVKQEDRAVFPCSKVVVVVAVAVLGCTSCDQWRLGGGGVGRGDRAGIRRVG